MQSNDSLKIIHSADYHVRNRNIPLSEEYTQILANIENAIVETQADVYAMVGDLFDFTEQNDSERKIIYRHIAVVLNIPTLKELVLMIGNHDSLVDKKKLLSNKDNNSIDTLRDFIATLSPELSEKLTYVKKQKQYISKADSRFAYIGYSLEDGFSNGNNVNWDEVDNSKFNITLFHDILLDYIDETGLPISKEKRLYLPRLVDFKTRNILAGDIHKNWSATTSFLQMQSGETERRFLYCGSNNQVNFSEGTTIKLRKNSQTIFAEKKVLKQHIANLNDVDSFLTTSDIPLNDVVTYINIDCNTRSVLPTYLREITNRLNNPTLYGSMRTFIKLKLSSSYIKHEVEIHDAITQLTRVYPKVMIEVVHDKLIVETVDNIIHEFVEGEEYEDDEFDDSEEVLDETLTALSSDKLLEMFTKCVTDLLGSEGDSVDDNIIESVKGIFIDQLKVVNDVNKNLRTYNTQLLDIECNGFMKLGANIIDLDVVGLTRIVGTNGVGKTTLYNMIRYVIDGIVFENLKQSQKVKNTLLIFNDNFQSDADDTIYVRMRSIINGTPIRIIRSAIRKWKTNTTTEQKCSKNWKTFISGVTSTVSLEISKDGEPMKTLVGVEAETYIKLWFGDVTNTIMILNQQKLLNMLNLPSADLQSLILRYVGVDYLDVLVENIDGIKLNYNLQRPKTNIVELRLSLEEKNKLSESVDELKRKSDSDIESNNSDIVLSREHIQKLNTQNLEFGNLPKLIEDSNLLISSYNSDIDNFKPLDLPQPVTEVKPIQTDTTNLVDEITVLNVENSERDTINMSIEKQYNELYATNDETNKKNNKLISDAKQKNVETNELVDIEFQKIHTNYNVTLNALKLKLEEKAGDVSSANTKIGSDKVSINTLNLELSSGVCESCSRAFDEETHEKHKVTISEKISVLQSNIVNNNKIVSDTNELIVKIRSFIATYTLIVEASVRKDLVWFDNNLLLVDELTKSIITGIKTIKESLIDLDSIILNELISESSEQIKKFRLLIKENLESNKNTQEKIDKLKDTISDFRDTYITKNDEYVRICNVYQNQLDSVNKHNNAINDVRNQLVQEKEKNKGLVEKLPNYDYLQQEISVTNGLLEKLNETKDSLSEEKTKLSLDTANLANEIEKLNTENNNYIEYLTHTKIMNTYSKIIQKNFPSVVFEYYVKHINKKLNILLENMSFKLFLDLDCELFLVDLSQGNVIYRPVSSISGMQNIFLGLSLIYTISMLNIKNTIGHIFIDEISGALNSGKDVVGNDYNNYQEQLLMLLSKFVAGRKVFIIDHVISNMFEANRFNVVFGEDNKSYYVN